MSTIGSCRFRPSGLLVVASASLLAAPVWRAPTELPFGKLAVLELREDDPKQPPLPRPGDERLGPLMLRSVEAMSDGRGWKLTVQAFAPGLAVVPPMDLGDGRRTPELRLKVVREVRPEPPVPE